MTDMRCPHCGELNRKVATPAPEPPLCRRCGNPLMPPPPPSSAQLARERLLGDASLSRVPKHKAATVDIDIDSLETVNLTRLLSRMHQTPRPLPTPAPLPRPRAAPFPTQATAPRPGRLRRDGSLRVGLFWFAGSLALAGLAAAQAVWHLPQLLDLHPALRPLAEQGCAAVGCTLPAGRAPGAVEVLSSQLDPVDGVPGVSTLRVRLRNGAASSTPLPGLRLTLLDANQRAVARRRIVPAEYQPGPDAELPGGAEVEVRLLLEAPQHEVFGFQIDVVATPSNSVRGAHPTGVSHHR